MQEVTVDNSDIKVDNVGYVGVLAQEVELVNGANVSVTNSGDVLPLISEWVPNGKQYENAVEMKKDGSLSVDKTSSVELTCNHSNSILIANGSLKNEGTINGDVIATILAGTMATLRSRRTAHLGKIRLSQHGGAIMEILPPA